jgi:hypothetical protein
MRELDWVEMEPTGTGPAAFAALALKMAVRAVKTYTVEVLGGALVVVSADGFRVTQKVYEIQLACKALETRENGRPKRAVVMMRREPGRPVYGLLAYVESVKSDESVPVPDVDVYTFTEFGIGGALSEPLRDAVRAAGLAVAG